jgi:hypothetical protein
MSNPINRIFASVQWTACACRQNIAWPNDLIDAFGVIVGLMRQQVEKSVR